jgi:hypothetical protein
MHRTAYFSEARTEAKGSIIVSVHGLFTDATDRDISLGRGNVILLYSLRDFELSQVAFNFMPCGFGSITSNTSHARLSFFPLLSNTPLAGTNDDICASGRER